MSGLGACVTGPPQLMEKLDGVDPSYFHKPPLLLHSSLGSHSSQLILMKLNSALSLKIEQNCTFFGHEKHQLHIRFPPHLESDSAHFWIINPEIFTVDNRWERQIYFLNKTISKHLKAVRGCLSTPVPLFSTGCSILYLTDTNPTYRTMVLHPSVDGLFHSEEKTPLGPRCTTAVQPLVNLFVINLL